MRKALLAIAALTGFAGVSSAAKIVVNNQQFADVGVKTQIYAQSLEDAANGGKDNAIDFTIQNARIYFLGQLNPIVKFGLNFDFPVTGGNTSHEATSTAKVRDAFIDFAFNPMLNVMAGYTRVPFSRATLTGRYDRIFMPQDGWVTVNGPYKDQLLPTLNIGSAKAKIIGPEVRVTAEDVLGAPTLGNAVAMTGTTDEADYSRDAGVTVWGSYGKGLVTYYVGVYDSFGDHNVGDVVNAKAGTNVNVKDNLGYVIRVQFSPTMLGYQGEGQDYYLKETYLGEKKVATVGIAYATTKLDLTTLGSYKFKSWTIDANYEAPYGVFVPKFEAAYVYTDADNLPLTDGTNDFTLDKVKTWYVTLGALYNQQIWLGKVGAYLKYQYTKVETSAGDIKPKTWTVAVPYYLAGQNAKIVLQWNHYDYDKKGLDPRNANDDSNNDFTLAFQVQF
jgi:hypothetical protein